ncbi:MAG: 23S rRNA pseudouridine(2604) synthase RluF [Saprospiraceae bacterium]|nr:23S rRNA pseudouridine(2604) synthase RluF [Saprospiraceae bacterium]
MNRKVQESISLNKYISMTGVCSRREADKWIVAGRVAINGVIAQKGNRVLKGDKVTLDGLLIDPNIETVYIALHKPVGITCTTDLKDRDNIIDFVNHPKRIFPIGRLDKGSSGLILLTNDGDIVNRILRAENNHEKEYVVSVDKAITRSFLRKMAAGVPVLNTVTKRCKILSQSDSTFRIVLTQGLNRQIRRMCEYLGYRVISLHRVRIMHIELGKLKPGAWRNLSDKELSELLARL